MKQTLNLRRLSLLIALVFTSNILLAEVVRSDSTPRATDPTAVRGEVVRSDSTPRVTTPAVQGEVVRSDSTPRVTTPAVQGEVVRSDSTPRVTTPAVQGEVVRSDSTPRMTTPAVQGEVVRSDSTPRATTPAVKGEVVRSDSTPRTAVPPAAQPKAFVGEIAVGASLLIAYGPQILALAATITTLAAGVSLLVNTSKSSLDLVKSIGAKLNRMLQLLLGPLSVSSGVAKEGVNDLSAHLLTVAKFVSNSVSMPVPDLQNEVKNSIGMSRDIQGIAEKGLAMSRDFKGLAAGTNADLSKIIAGGEVQVYRDGAGRVAGFFEAQADRLDGTFNQTLAHARQSTNALTGLEGRINAAVAATGRPAAELTLGDIELSAAEVGKSLLAARKEMVGANQELLAADKGSAGMHNELLALMQGIKADLENFAAGQGIKGDDLQRAMKEAAAKAQAPAGLRGTAELKAANADETAKRLAEQINLFTDDLTRLGQKCDFSIQKLSGKDSDKKVAPKANADKLEGLYLKKSQAYKNYIRVLTTSPDKVSAVAEAKAAFEEAESAYQNAAAQN